MNAHDEVAVGVGEVRPQPGDRLDLIAHGVREDETCATGDLELYDSGDLDVTDLPLVHRPVPLSEAPPGARFFVEGRE